ncbi:hypothetical protein GGX14DRAFT_386743 [Mycena pura]|uniref:Uncharacterized protein n=1 Tax=Mycena pura TaxID=153505 RepID=A0AAD7E404_9AGAR|nr:hypothetical protein GGX14DRAFT_386743 [Mycena pura]
MNRNPQKTPNPSSQQWALSKFKYDLASSKYQYRWDNWAKFLEWLSQEQQHECIELRLVNTNESAGVPWDLHRSGQLLQCAQPSDWEREPSLYANPEGDKRVYCWTSATQGVAGTYCILKLVHRGVYDSDDIFERDLDDASVAARTEFIQLRDIRALRKDRLCDVQNTLRVD